ncbi:isochorismatase family protein [Paenalcaligenes sp. Me131]|uniref:isochorismatase family protein n=1 Tax=Paenalcaligenes sp. Me131 TaxID=3392636 RepID=UPI003D290C83
MSHIHQLPSYTMPDVSVPNRVQWEVQADRAVLLIHDMQHYFLNKYDMQAEPIPTLVRHIQAIKAQCVKLGIPVIYTAQPTEQNPEDRALLTDFWGLGLSAPEYAGQEAVIDELAPSADDILQTKWRYSAFFRSPMREQMQAWSRDQLIVTGIYAHIGCMTTSLDAFMQGVQAFMVSDAVADFSEEEHRMALRYVSQRCGVVVNSQTLLTQLGAE